MLLDRETIIDALRRLDLELGARGVRAAGPTERVSCWRRCSMTAHDLVSACAGAGDGFQVYVNAFVDEFRGASQAERAALVAAGPTQDGRFEGLVAGVVSALCREAAMEAPAWLRAVHSPEPFFVLGARSFALRLRLMLESPPPFRCRNVFVPESYLSRA